MHAHFRCLSPRRFDPFTFALAMSVATLACGPRAEAVADTASAGGNSGLGQDSVARLGVERSIAALHRAQMREDVDTLVSYYAENFLMRRDGEPDTHGREGIRARWVENFAGWAYERPLLTIDRFTSGGSLAVTGGLVGGTLREKKPGGTAQRFELPYLASWTRAEDGRWLFRDLMVLPPASAAK